MAKPQRAKIGHDPYGSGSYGQKCTTELEEKSTPNVSVDIVLPEEIALPTRRCDVCGSHFEGTSGSCDTSDFYEEDKSY